MKLRKNKLFLNNFCNFKKLNNLIISFDIDWAPEFMIEDLLNLTEKINITIFNTHKSNILKTIDKNKVTLGIHPNLQKNSSQGNNNLRVKNFVKNVGNMKYLRFHLLGHSYRDLSFFANKGAKIDSSTLLINQSYLSPVYHPDIDLVRVPYIWEDGMTLNFKTNIKKSLDLKSPGLKILDFHPIDIYLNTSNINQRNKFKKSFSSVLNASKQEADKFINKKNYGIRNFLIDILKLIKTKNIKTSNFDELNYEFRKNIK
jgi:hypothetical protein